MEPVYQDADDVALFQRIGATAIANQAILKCLLAEIPVTVDNVILFVGDFLDPGDKRHEKMIGLIERAIEEVVEVAAVARAAGRRGDGAA